MVSGLSSSTKLLVFPVLMSIFKYFVGFQSLVENTDVSKDARAVNCFSHLICGTRATVCLIDHRDVTKGLVHFCHSQRNTRTCMRRFSVRVTLLPQGSTAACRYCRNVLRAFWLTTCPRVRHKNFLFIGKSHSPLTT